VPQRRLTALTLALVATAGVASGCAIELEPESIPAPFSQAPIPSASVGVPAYVCTAAYKILTDGAVKLAGYLSSSSDTAKQGMRDAFADMATKVDAEAALTADTELKTALAAVSADLRTGSAETADPKAYVDGGFQTVGQKLDGACADA